MTLLQAPPRIDVVDRVLEVFLEHEPTWCKAVPVADGILVEELRCGYPWHVRRRSVENALERMRSLEGLPGLESEGTYRRDARKLRDALMPELVITPAFARAVVQVAIFGGLEYT